jgi:hypothetical protein
MAIAMVVMSACNDDDSPVLEPKPEDLVPFAMTYVDFITPDDVQILTADTTSISVSSAYAEKMGIKFFKDRAVTIWRTMGTVPFIRIITDAQENNGKIILTTKEVCSVTCLKTWMHHLYLTFMSTEIMYQVEQPEPAQMRSILIFPVNIWIMMAFITLQSSPHLI